MFFKQSHRSRIFARSVAAVFLLSFSSSYAHAGEAQILWDKFGIPHIYGPDLLSVVRGLGYAEMENHAETILLNVAAARGRSAEYFGPGTNNANITNDIAVRTEGIPGLALTWLLTGGAEQANILQAFTDGANEYATRHSNTINSLFQQVLPLVPTDITGGIINTVHFHFMPNQDNLPVLIEAWQNGGLAAANLVACSLTPGCSTNAAVAQNNHPGGSNGWAIAPGRSASGNAILMGNPHVPWGNNVPIPPVNGLGLYQWMEANLVIGDPQNPTLNASGVALAGAPFLGIAYSDKLGWTHTNNTIQNTNLYEITLNSDGFTYNFGGYPLPLVPRTDTIKIRQPDGTLASQTITILASIHGPIVAKRVDAQKTTKMLALRVAGLGQPGMIKQYWDMIQANNLDEFIAANSALQMPFFNVIYADRDGHTLYSFGGLQPVRPNGDWGKYSGILDGSDPSLLWTSTFGWWELPYAIDPDLVANSNNPPWTSTYPQTIAANNFPPYVAPQFMDLRAQHGASLLLSIPSLTVADILAFKESTHMLLADRVLDDLIKAALDSSNPTALAAAKVLSAWKANGSNSDQASAGAVLFETWWSLIYDELEANPALPHDNTINFYSPHPLFTTGWSPSEPRTTPSGLANAQTWVPDLITAANLVAGTACAKPPCPLNIAWGDVHKIILADHSQDYQTIKLEPPAPQSGADDPFGPLRVVYRFQPDPTELSFFAYSGDGYVQIVEFTKEGAKAQALLGYGNASRPGSPHITDQLSFFEAKTLRPGTVYRTPAEVMSNPPYSSEVVY
ncbi:MAG TPA: penicillin acylase family protein [Methylocella sp.]|nr:penicillin acylase family protein [Methylocella sp.]